MAANEYYSSIKDFEAKLRDYASHIFKTYGKALVLRLEEYNLLQNKHNCIESSTAIGFVLEEFIVAKFEMYTHCDDETEYVIDRFIGATTSESYDFFSEKNGIRFMVNVKAEKSGSANNAVAAISQLHRNYCLEYPEKRKSYVLLKILYTIGDENEDCVGRRALPRHIHIDGIESYCLEEVDFSNGHKQDNRRWSDKTNTAVNGRLIISPKFREMNKVAPENVSYQSTFNMIKGIYDGTL